MNHETTKEEALERLFESREKYFRDEADRLSVLRHLMLRMQEDQQQANEVLRGMFGSQYTIDEMALVTPGTHQLFTFMKDLVALEGYELFNRADDVVEVAPLPAAYVVEYWFLRTPYDYRIELMRIVSGYSPLHETYIRGEASSYVMNVHASFKVPDMAAYTEAQVVLRKQGWEMAQRCESQYGRFSYYNNDDEMPRWYLKPRVNLRDADNEVGAW